MANRKKDFTDFLCSLRRFQHVFESLVCSECLVDIVISITFVLCMQNRNNEFNHCFVLFVDRIKKCSGFVVVCICRLHVVVFSVCSVF